MLTPIRIYVNHYGMETTHNDAPTMSVTVRLPVDKMRDLRVAAVEDNRSLNGLIGKILLDWLKLRALADELQVSPRLPPKQQ